MASMTRRSSYTTTSSCSRKPITIRDCHFSRNSSVDDSGAVYLTAKTIARIERCTFDANRSASNGGALRVTFGSEVVVNESTFTNNIANTDADTNFTDQANLLGSISCDDLIASYDALKKSKQCVLSTGKGMKEGGAGGAIYLLEKKGYLPLHVAIVRSEFKNDVSEHREIQQRAEIVAHECSLLELDNVAFPLMSPIYKLSLHNLAMKNVLASGLELSCSNSKVLTSDPAVFLHEVTCR